MTIPKPEKEQILEGVDTVIYEVPEPPKIEIRDHLLKFMSTDAENILVDDYVKPGDLQDRAIEQIKEEHKFDEVKDTFAEGKSPLSLNFFLEATIIMFLITCKFLSLS